MKYVVLVLAFMSSFAFADKVTIETGGGCPKFYAFEHSYNRTALINLCTVGVQWFAGSSGYSATLRVWLPSGSYIDANEGTNADKEAKYLALREAMNLTNEE